MSGLNATMAMARRSSAEKPLLRVAVSFTASDVVVTRTLCPSGAAPLTDFAARLPPAPPRFSTTTACPKRSLSFCPTRRATTSAMPPAANATCNVMFCVGWVCVQAGCARPAAATTTKMPSSARTAACGVLSVLDRSSCGHRRPHHAVDAGGSGRKHDQPIEAERNPAGLRHHRKGAEKILVDGIALAVDALLLRHLMLEPCALLGHIDELAEAVRKLDPAGIELEALGEP